MGSFSDELAGVVRAGFCSVINVPATALEIMKQYSPLLPGDLVQYNTPRQLYRAVCDREPPDLPSPPFTGGQCDAVYNVRVVNDFVVIANGNVVDHSDQTIAVPGSIKGLQLVGAEGGTQTLNIIGGASGNPGATTYTFAASNTVSTLAIRNQAIVSVTRVDGQPDNCGNPPTPVPPYTPGGNTYNTNLTYNSGGTAITIPVGLAFGYAALNVNGQLNIPVRVQLNVDPTFNVNFNLSTGNIEFDFGGGAGRNPNSPDVRITVQPYDTTTDDDSPTKPPGTGIPNPVKPPDPSTDKVIIGCLVTVTTVALGNGKTLIGQEDNPDIYAPSMGNVNFLVPANGLASGWTPDQPIKNRRTYIPCPAPQGAIRVAGTFAPGFTGVIQPVYSKKNQPVLTPA